MQYLLDPEYSRFNETLFLALREALSFGVTDHAFALAAETGRRNEEHRFINIRHCPRGRKVHCEGDIQCRLQERCAYIQYSKDDGSKATLKIDLSVIGEGSGRTYLPLEVGEEEFPSCRRKEHKEPAEYCFYGHDITGTEEWSWKWVEEKEQENEARKELLRDYILPSPEEPERERNSKAIIAHDTDLTCYRLCEVSNSDRSTVQRYLTADFQSKNNWNMHVCCGDIFSSSDYETKARLLSSGRGVRTTTKISNELLGIYSGNFESCYALCYRPEGFVVVWFRLQTVNP